MQEPSTYSTAILSGLGTPGHGLTKRNRYGWLVIGATERHVYGGTVPYETIQKRRAKNRVARKSRRTNRLRSK